MQTSGVNYYYENIGLPRDIWQVYYSFENTGINISSVSGGYNACSGLGIGNFSYHSGTGFFNKNSLIKIQNSSGSLDNWTLITKVKKIDSHEGVIFSSFLDGNIYSGFSFGLTANNRMFLESFSELGPNIIVSNIILGEKSIISATKAGQSIYFDYFDPNSKTVESEQYDISSKSFLSSNSWIVGGTSGAPAHCSSQNFSGHIYDFLLFNSPLLPSETLKLFLGLVSNTSISGEPIYVDSEIFSLGMDGFGYLYGIKTTDSNEIYTITGKHDFIFSNQDAIFDGTINEFYGNSGIDTTGINFYINGIAQVGVSGYSITGNFYNNNYILSGDYIPSGNQFFSNSKYLNADRGVYDIVPLQFENFGYFNNNFSHNGDSEQVLTTNSGSLDLVFFNGVKLYMNSDYTPSGGNIIFQSGNPLYLGVTGRLSIFPNNYSYYRYGGFSGISSTLDKFSRKSSLIWINGIRQNLGDMYVEISRHDLLSGYAVFYRDGLLFRNEELFINM